MSYGTIPNDNTGEHSDTALQKKISLLTLKKMQAAGEKITVVALYDAPMAAMAQNSGVEIVLVGDSLGMTVLGFDSTLPVTMDNMIYHTEAVKRGNTRSLIMGDLPFMSCSTIESALENSAKIMQAGANIVKLEGGEWLADTISKLSDRGIPVCAHIGLTPQSVNKFGGFRVQGKDEKSARKLIHDAKLLERAGADMLLLECVPAELAKTISDELHIPTIGIGAGKDTDAQVLVINDILGLTPHPPKFSKNFLVESDDIASALKKYVRDVKTGTFPSDEHIFN